MTEFNELKATNDYLVSELITTRKENDLMRENNRRLENMLIKCIKELQECNRLLDEMKFQVGELATIALNRVKKS